MDSAAYGLSRDGKRQQDTSLREPRQNIRSSISHSILPVSPLDDITTIFPY